MRIRQLKLICPAKKLIRSQWCYYSAYFKARRMSILGEIKDRGAVLEWSPFKERSSLVAVGTKDSAGAGFDEYGGEMELFDMDFKAPSSTPTTPIGSVKAA